MVAATGREAERAMARRSENVKKGKAGLAHP